MIVGARRAPGRLPRHGTHAHRRSRDPHLGAVRQGSPGAGRAGGRGRVPAGHRAVHRPRRAVRGRRARLRPRREEPARVQRRVLHRGGHPAGAAGDAAAGAGRGRPVRCPGADRGRRGRHRGHPEAGEGLLRRPRGGGALRGGVREAALDGALRVRLAPSRRVVHGPGGARAAGGGGAGPGGGCGRRPGGGRRPVGGARRTDEIQTEIQTDETGPTGRRGTASSRAGTACTAATGGRPRAPPSGRDRQRTRRWPVQCGRRRPAPPTR